MVTDTFYILVSDIELPSGYTPKLSTKNMGILKKSIAKHGVQNPIRVKRNDPEKPTRYLLIDGGARLICCRALDFRVIPAKIVS